MIAAAGHDDDNDDDAVLQERARDLVSRLQNIDEKIALLATTSGGVPSLGIAPFQWWCVQ